MVWIAMGMISSDRLDLPDDIEEISQKVLRVRFVRHASSLSASTYPEHSGIAG